MPLKPGRIDCASSLPELRPSIAADVEHSPITRTMIFLGSLPALTGQPRAAVPHGYFSIIPEPHAHDFALMGEVQAKVCLIAIPQPNKFPVAVLVASFFSAQNLHTPVFF
jgi:hypothetical protein